MGAASSQAERAALATALRIWVEYQRELGVLGFPRAARPAAPAAARAPVAPQGGAPAAPGTPHAPPCNLGASGVGGAGGLGAGGWAALSVNPLGCGPPKALRPHRLPAALWRPIAFVSLQERPG